MLYNISKQRIDGIPFDAYFNGILNNDNEFIGKAGTEHYRLLSYFSTLFNGQNILDIGSHKGNSALALSYNNSNTVYSFDIVDNIHPDIKLIENIRFYKENILDDNTCNKWKNVILSCPFIFMDVDPHNGNMEMQFYKYLKKIGYNVFVIFDDILYFKEMRDNFWYKIPYEERYDLTNYGHWSGTGIVSFNKDITFEKYDNSNWTLVTAYFNLTKCYDASREILERDNAYYFSHSVSTLSLPYNLVIYCDAESLPVIEKLRPDFLKEKTKYIVCNFDDFQFKKNGIPLKERFADYRDKIIENRKRNPYHFDNRNTGSYYLFCMSRYVMLKEVIETNPFQSSHFGWINFCIERMGTNNLIRLDEALSIKREKFSTCYIDYVPEELVKNTHEYFTFGRCSMCSGFFTGNAEYMTKACDLIEDKFLYYLEEGYGHADEQLYSPVYFENPELFEHYYGDYNQMITNYKYIYESPDPPIYNFIANSYQYGNYVKCYEACEFVFNSYCLDKCAISEFYLNELYHYYMNCKKHLYQLASKL
jgi:hypothetical protein